MATAINQREHLDQLLRDSAEIDARAEALAARLGPGQLNWSPPEGGWGVGQVFEHLCVANDSYLERFEAILARPDAPRATEASAWRPSVMGGMLARALSPRSTRKTRAPKRYRVGGTPRPNVVGEFLRRQRDLEAYMRRAAPLDWRRTRTTSPISPLIRLNLGDCFTILVVHAQRHMGQIERLLGRPDFPAG
jgi:uncharacterized damage-inducible protein DinB